MCTVDAYAFLVYRVIEFEFDPQPSFSELIIFSDIDFLDSFYFIQKTGHFISFGLLYVFVLNWLNNWKQALIICAVFAVSSEVLQLYFQRNGRLFDAFIDLCGIFLAYSICRYLKNIKRTMASS
ncbi:VanZ family protein [Planomicrobium soli]|nr:VanZ family protein [Planomicrobium soli]